jgi:hypothetical protein
LKELLKELLTTAGVYPGRYLDMLGAHFIPELERRMTNDQGPML